MAATSIGPGLLLVRRLNWRPLETLCASIALSHLLLYCAGMAIFAFDLPIALLYVTTVAAVAATFLCARDLRRLGARRHVRHAALACLALFTYVLLMQFIAQHYGGTGWYGDWFEHYERSVFFLARPGPDYPFLHGWYTLTARPPLMNVVAAHYLAHVGVAFEPFQIIFTFLNTLAFLPAALLLPMLVRGARRPVFLLCALCALSPFFVQNVLWTWTKLYTVFLVLLALALYLRGLRSESSARIVAAFTAFAAAALTHYSTGPFLLFTAGHYILTVLPSRRHRRRELATVVVTGALVLATWFGWAIHTYGVADTFGANTTVEGYAGKTAGQKIADVAVNVYATVVPYPLRGLAVYDPGVRTNQWATLRDAVFHLYQTNLLLAFGSIGWAIVLVLLTRTLLLKRGGNPRERRFWLGLVLFCVPVGIATHGEPELYGLAQVIAQPLVVLGIAVIAAGFSTLPLWLRQLYVLGLAVDFALGIFIHLQLLAHAFEIVVRPTGDVEIDLGSGIGAWSGNNYLLKVRAGVTYLADHVVAWQPLLQAAVALCGVAAIFYVLRLSRAGSGPRLETSD